MIHFVMQYSRQVHPVASRKGEIGGIFRPESAVEQFIVNQPVIKKVPLSGNQMSGFSGKGKIVPQTEVQSGLGQLDQSGGIDEHF